jgi:hypothetical protein
LDALRQASHIILGCFQNDQTPHPAGPALLMIDETSPHDVAAGDKVL